MGKLFDQRFSIYFELWGWKVGSDPADYTTPAYFRFIRLDQYYMSNLYYRTASVYNAFNSAQLPVGYLCDEPRGEAQTPFVWHPEISNLETPDFGAFVLEFGNLNLPLTDEVIALINDPDEPRFSRTWSIGNQLAVMKSFNGFYTRRKVIRKTYNSRGTLTKTKESNLLTTNSALEVPLELDLTVSRVMTTSGRPNIRCKITPVQNMIEIHSTGEENTSWS